VRGSTLQADRLAINIQPAPAEGFVQHGEGPAQGGVSAGLVRVRPEQRGQPLAALVLARDRQVGEEGDGLARVGFNRRARTLDAGRAEQVEFEAGGWLAHGFERILLENEEP